MSAAYYTQVQKIYVAYYGRPADPAGLQYWAGQLAANGGNLTSIINAFGNSSESTALYAGASDSAKVTAIYQQLFNRAPDGPGLAFYTAELTAGRMTAASIALNVANGAQGTDLTFLNNKVTVGTAFTDALTVDGAAAVAYTGTTAITAARSLITGVTTSAATTNVASTITSIKSGGGATAGQTFTLTAGADTITLTDGNNSATATIGQLGNGDKITDASTKDSDSITAEIFGNTDSTLTMTNIENLTLKAMAGTSVVDATNVTGVNTLTHAGTGNLSVTNLSTPSTILAVSGTSSSLTAAYVASKVTGGADTVTINAVAPTAGTVTLTGAIENVAVKAVGKSALTNVAATSATALTFSGDEISVGSTSARIADNFALVNSTATKSTLYVNGVAGQGVITAAGDDTVDLATALAASNLINMGGGSDTLVLRGTGNAAATLVGVENVTTKTAASTVALANADSAVAITVEGGGATTVTGAKAGTTFKSTEASTAATSFTFRDTETATSLTLDMTEGSTGAYTLTNVGKATIKAGKAVTGGAIALDETAGGTVVTSELTLDLAVSGASFALGAITNTSKLTDFTINATKAGVTETGAGNADIAEAESLKNYTLNAVGGAITLDATNSTVGNTAAATALDKIILNASGGAITSGTFTIANPTDVSTITVTATGGAVTSGTLTNSAAGFGTVTVTGSKDVTLSLTTTVAAGEKIDRYDASGLTGALTATVTNVGNAGDAGTVMLLGDAASGKTNTVSVLFRDNSVTGGSGVDVITGGTGNDTIHGAGGNDTLTLDAGSDSASGGDGDDTISGAAGNDTILGGAGVDSITGGTGVDSITGGGGADTFVYSTDGSVAGTALDVITDFNSGGSDILDFAATAVLLAAETNGATATSDVDTSAGGLISFAAADDTYAEKVTAIQADTQLDAIASVAFFEDGGNTYVYYAGAATGNTDDQIIQLTGVTGLTTITVTAGNITIA